MLKQLNFKQQKKIICLYFVNCPHQSLNLNDMKTQKNEYQIIKNIPEATKWFFFCLTYNTRDTILNYKLTSITSFKLFR